jgi:glycosyltransferase involved in cell wall biosynthesis
VKVLYLVPQPKRPDRIGAYTFIDEEVEALAAAGIDALVLSTAAPFDARHRGVQLRSALSRRSPLRNVGTAAFLLRQVTNVPGRNLTSLVKTFRTARLEHVAADIVRREKVDLIHSHFAWPQGFGGMLAHSATRRPLVATLRGTDILLEPSIQYGRRTDPCFDRAVRRLLRLADRTVYFSRYMRDKGLALGARPEAARMIRKGVDLTQFTVAADRPALRAELGLGSAPMVMTVAGLIPRKGVDHIIEALASLGGSREFTFVVCGEGPERPALEALASQRGMTDRVRFVGRVDRSMMPRYFAACDIFVLASIVEAAGNVLFEAMAAGRPIVCTDSGGPPEYVRDGETGFVVAVGDRGAMAARIGQLLDDAGLQDRLGAEGRRRTIGEFGYQRMVQDIIAVYDETLARPSV